MVTSPVHLLSIESSPPFVNRVQSTFCQLSPVHLLSIESSPPFVNRVQSTFCQSSPVHLLLIESSPPFVNRVQSTFCQSSPVHVLSYAVLKHLTNISMHDTRPTINHFNRLFEKMQVTAILHVAYQHDTICPIPILH